MALIRVNVRNDMRADAHPSEDETMGYLFTTDMRLRTS